MTTNWWRSRRKACACARKKIRGQSSDFSIADRGHFDRLKALSGVEGLWLGKQDGGPDGGQAVSWSQGCVILHPLSPGEVGLTFSVTHSNAMFVGLDEYSDYSVIRHLNQEWLDTQLSARPGPHLFVFGHTTAFALTNETSLATYPAERDELWQRLTQAGGRLFFGAHVHVYDRARIAVDVISPAIEQIVVGAGGAWLDRLDTGHYPDPRVQHQYG